MDHRMSNLSFAPYNFVPFPDKVKERYGKFEDLPTHNGEDEHHEELLSGEISFDIVAESPILVAQGNEVKNDPNRHFNKNTHDQYEIPGSTLRGLLRNAIGIIGHSDLTGFVNKDETLMYRGLADASDKGLKNRKKEYENLINKDQVKAGYIRMNTNGSYEIASAKEIFGKTYNFVREQQLYKEKVLPHHSIKPMYTRDILALEEVGRPKPPEKSKRPPLGGRTPRISDKHEILKEYKKRLNEYHIELQKPGNNRDSRVIEKLKNDYKELYGFYYAYLSKCQVNSPEPYCAEQDFNVCINERGIYSFVQQNQGKSYACRLMASGFMQKKQAHYIIHPLNEHQAVIALSDIDIKSYNFDWEVKGNRMKNRDFYALPKTRGEWRPCFYHQQGGQTYFGFTPNMRVYYKHNIGHGLPQYNVKGIDYIDSLFGFVNKKFDNSTKSYASRLSFKSAIMDYIPNAIRDEEVVLGQPRLSAVALYIQQDDAKNLKTLNDDGYKWRGMKQYWLKKDFKGKKGESDKVNSKLHLLPEGSTFKTLIRFDRIHKDELGLLLAALTWPNHQTIGMGKPYGAGCVNFKNHMLKLDEISYNLENFFAPTQHEIADNLYPNYINTFCEQMKSDCESIKKSETVSAYLAMRSQTYDSNPEYTEYMEVSVKNSPTGKPTYQSLYPLPTIDQFLGKGH